MMSPNVIAFLSMISNSEGTVLARDPYRCCYSFKHTIIDLSAHPAVSGEWKGESIAHLGPQYAGEVSTAAGRYQITKHWWLKAAAACDLTNFEPASQDAAACWLIAENQAMHAIEAGHIGEAIERCRSIWASLPGGTSGQPEHALKSLVDVYQRSGGTVA